MNWAFTWTVTHSKLPFSSAFEQSCLISETIWTRAKRLLTNTSVAPKAIFSHTAYCLCPHHSVTLLSVFCLLNGSIRPFSLQPPDGNGCLTWDFLVAIDSCFSTLILGLEDVEQRYLFSLTLLYSPSPVACCYNNISVGHVIQNTTAVLLSHFNAYFHKCCSAITSLYRMAMNY